MVNTNLLKAEIAKVGMTQRELAAKMNRKPAWFSWKMRNRSFRTEEAQQIIDILGIKDRHLMAEIFFGNK